MFKASIALVLLAFGALAYGWIAGNDTVLYGSIGASALAGLALLRSTMADRSARPKPERAERRERPERPERRERAERHDRTSREGTKGKSGVLATDAAVARRRGRSPESDEVSRRLDLSSDYGDEDTPAAPLPSVKPFIPPAPARKRRPRAPEGAAWAREEGAGAESSLGGDTYDREQGAYDSGFQEEPYPDEDLAGSPTSPSRAQEGAAAADDFRSRLAAVLGPAGGQQEAPPPPKPARARRTTPGPAPAVAEPGEPKPARRGRKKAQPVLPESEAGSEPEGEDVEPDWIRIDDLPRISRATQPGGGFARPEIPQGMTPYRPRRPGLSQDPSSEEAPARTAAPRRRSASAEKTGSSTTRAASPKRPAAGKTAAGKTAAGSKTAAGKTAAGKTAAGKTAPSNVSETAKPRARSTKERDPDAPPPRRGRPPKPKP